MLAALSAIEQSRGATETALEYADRSVHLLESAIQRDPQNQNARTFLPGSLALRAKVLRQLSHYQKAASDLNRAVDLSPAFMRPVHLLNQAGLMADLGDYTAAVRQSRSSIEILTQVHDLDQTSNSVLQHASNLALAAAAVERDQQLDPSQRTELRREYVSEVVTTLRVLLDAGKIEPLLLSQSPEFTALRDQATYRELEELFLP
jgi:tetratricopeptide (TPR) repeat protein